MPVLFVGSDTHGGTIQAGPCENITIKRTSSGGGTIIGSGIEAPLATHTPTGPWKYDGVLELEQIDLVQAIEDVPEEALTLVVPEPKPRKKRGGGRKKKQPVAAEPPPTEEPTAMDPVEQAIREAEAGS